MKFNWYACKLQNNEIDVHWIVQAEIALMLFCATSLRLAMNELPSIRDFFPTIVIGLIMGKGRKLQEARRGALTVWNWKILRNLYLASEAWNLVDLKKALWIDETLLRLWFFFKLDFVIFLPLLRSFLKIEKSEKTESERRLETPKLLKSFHFTIWREKSAKLFQCLATIRLNENGN